MSNKPVFVATHPRACSTAFERVFMTCRSSIQTVHEPFGDAFYFGPERLGTRFAHDEDARRRSGFAESTFKTIVDRIEREGAEGKRVFIKDISHYLVPPNRAPARLAPSLQQVTRGGCGGTSADAGEDGDADAVRRGHDDATDVAGIQPRTCEAHACAAEAEEEEAKENPTVLPREILERFHFTFLIRHPRHAIPSYYRCCVPPLVDRTRFAPFMPEEAGYDELRRLFDYLKDTGLVGPKVCGAAAAAAADDDDDDDGRPSHDAHRVEICVVDADDLLDDPAAILRQYCASVGLPFRDAMLRWDDDDARAFAQQQFGKWNGFHDDAINSTDLKPRQHKKAPPTEEQSYAQWVDTYGPQAADVIRNTVAANLAHYEYLKQFAIPPSSPTASRSTTGTAGPTRC